MWIPFQGQKKTLKKKKNQSRRLTRWPLVEDVNNSTDSSEPDSLISFDENDYEDSFNKDNANLSKDLKAVSINFILEIPGTLEL